jgi:hypothetical protein
VVAVHSFVLNRNCKGTGFPGRVRCVPEHEMSSAALGRLSRLCFSVRQGTPEIGVRLALGADPSRIAQMVLRDGLPHPGFRHDGRHGRGTCRIALHRGAAVRGGASGRFVPRASIRRSPCGRSSRKSGELAAIRAAPTGNRTLAPDDRRVAHPICPAGPSRSSADHHVCPAIGSSPREQRGHLCGDDGVHRVCRMNAVPEEELVGMRQANGGTWGVRHASVTFVNPN